ncbi:MAG: 2-isopropylmalate synthase [Thaumarchaeota archaeon]|nr:2-isopropylmalate synthase [Nitrososphaerota archaeon]
MDPNAHAEAHNGQPAQKIRILDSTLREGEQHPGVSFTNKQRIQIAWELDSFGVDQIEISPVVSPDHREATRTIIGLGLEADIVSHGRALRRDVDVSIDCGAEWCAAYLGISEVHMADKLRITREEAMERAIDTVQYAKSHGLKVRFTLEDGSRADPEFVREVCVAIRDAGVDRISLPDTVGVMRPAGMARFVGMVRDTVDTPLDVHTHNDMGLALANSLAGVDAGADQIHTTIDGIGERTGIPSLAEAAVVITRLYKSPNRLKLYQLRDLSKHIEMYTGIPIPESKPVVGSSAYKHKAGTHLAAILRNPAAYEPVPPDVVGNRRTIVFGELSGKTGAGHLMSILGLEGSDQQARDVAAGLKRLRMGDLLEMPLPDSLVRRITPDE